MVGWELNCCKRQVEDKERKKFKIARYEVTGTKQALSQHFIIRNLTQPDR
jgi:hypothetical protein